jgi:hypothetical protein
MLVAGWRIARRQFHAAASLIDQLIAEAPHMSFPRVLRAQCLNLRGAPRTAQVRACREVLRVQPGNAYAISVLGQPEPPPARFAAAEVASPSDLYGSVLVGAGVPGVVVGA